MSVSVWVPGAVSGPPPPGDLVVWEATDTPGRGVKDTTPLPSRIPQDRPQLSIRHSTAGPEHTAATPPTRGRGRDRAPPAPLRHAGKDGHEPHPSHSRSAESPGYGRQVGGSKAGRITLSAWIRPRRAPGAGLRPHAYLLWCLGQPPGA
ncbi:hypothetical protein GCM10009603_31780 [Nocardiopsis exhalans]